MVRHEVGDIRACQQEGRLGDVYRERRVDAVTRAAGTWVGSRRTEIRVHDSIASFIPRRAFDRGRDMRKRKEDYFCVPPIR